MSKPSRLIFFGNERLATAATTTAPVLRALVAAGYEIEAVFASHQDAVSRQKRDLEIGQVTHQHNIPLILPGPKDNLLEKLQKHQAEAAVLVAYGKIIPQAVIDLFPTGIINIHPSLLPELRGPTPIETAILEGLEKTGVSLMKLTAKMDAGPVYAQKSLELTGSETKFELTEELGKLGAELLIENLAGILDGTIQPQLQAEADATYTKLITKQDGLISFNEPAEHIDRKVRAFLGWPKTRAVVHGQPIIITKARLANDYKDGGLVIECQPGHLEILELTGPSGRSMSGADFISGYKRT
ncbi:MAG TPA: methionyl-tRNA formyltransferase [Candidatus Saccharimonadales bacterium]|nr:methionyl-tRNA formyltransferase [Candidatus Saccharimonadales bacterium]